jgi:hypothetical protein
MDQPPRGRSAVLPLDGTWPRISYCVLPYEHVVLFGGVIRFADRRYVFGVRGCKAHGHVSMGVVHELAHGMSTECYVRFGVVSNSVTCSDQRRAVRLKRFDRLGLVEEKPCAC